MSTKEWKEPDIDEAIEISRDIMYLLQEKEYFSIETRLQSLAVALGRNPALVYPDYKERRGPDYWYVCPENPSHSLVFSKSRDDWVCPHCDL